MEIEIKDLEHIREAAKQFVEAMGDQHVFAFYGHMGAGKTTFIKALCEELGVEDVVTSPTFAIVNEYTPHSSLLAPHASIYHFDFYRLKSIAEAYDIGYEEYFYSGCYCFTEWTEKIEEILPDHYVRVEITESDNIRTLKAYII